MKHFYALSLSCLLAAQLSAQDLLRRQWVKTFAGPNDSVSYAAIDRDNAGNIYVAGRAFAPATDYDVLIIKYNFAGLLQWAMTYDGPVNDFDAAHDLAVDKATGDVYVTGASTGLFGNTDYITLKYNTLGLLQWEARYNGTGNGTDTAAAIVLDGAGNIIVTGGSTGIGFSLWDAVTVKYNPLGLQLWESRYNSPVNGPDMGISLATDINNDVYVTGFTTGGGGALTFSSSGIAACWACSSGCRPTTDRATRTMQAPK